jgi:hypothetical protein
VTYISTHVIDAENRLLEQYKNKPNIKALVDGLIGPVQTLEDAFNDLKLNRGISGAVGVQLDRLGDIVGIKRLGLDDETYRLRIKIQIVQNVSEGEPDRLIQVFQSLVGSLNVYYQENYPAGVNLMGGGSIAPGQEALIYENIQNIAPAGVRVDYIGTFPIGSVFAFEGGVTQSKGFGDSSDLTVGGGFGSMAVPVELEFRFSGGNPGIPANSGFGDLRDPVMGGHLIGT